MRRNRIAHEIELATKELSRPRYLRISSEILVHEVGTTRQACPCCGSKWAAIVERIPAGDLIVDLVIGDRLTEQDVTAQTWRDLVEIAQHHEIPVRCSRLQLPLLLDTSGRHIFASGSQRSGKTYCGLVWLALQWLRRGGFERRFWLVASTLPKAFRLLQKLFTGTGDTPAVLPRALLDYMPVTHRASDTQTRLVDGSCFDLKYFDGDPSGERLKSDDIVAGLCDEASHLPSEDSFTALDGRTLTFGGKLFFSSTPRPNSFLKKLLVEPAMEFERLPATDPRKIHGDHPGALWIFKALPYPENPWNDQEVVAAKMRTLDLSSPSVQRDFFGSWVGSTGPLWLDYSAEKHLVTHEARDFHDFGPTYLARLGLSNQIDITGTLVSRVFFGLNPHYKGLRANNKRFLIGTDVNCHPMSSVILQVSGDKDNPEDRDKWHFWAIDVVRTAHGNSQAHVGQLSSTFFGRVLEPKSKDSPFAGCGVVIDAQALGRDPTVHKWGGDPRGIAELFGRAGFDVRAPEYVPSAKGPVPKPPGRNDCYALVHRLLSEGRLHISQRCDPLHQGFTMMEDSGDGVTPKKNPPLDSAMDGLRYAIWGVVHARVRETFDRLA
jgi:hypothetical protein